jgi:putative heme-binding domain-containing protein
MKILPQVARFLAADKAAELVRFTTSRFADDADAQYQIYNIIQQGLDQAGATSGVEMKDWGIHLAEKYIAGVNTGWNYIIPNPNLKRNPLFIENAWHTQVPVIGFDTWGLKGSITSPVFEVPSNLQFLVALVDKPSGTSPESSQSEVRLVSAANKQVLKTSTFSRDVEYRWFTVDWDLAHHKGQRAYVEIFNDPNPGGFLKVGGFQPQVVQLPRRSPVEIANLQLFALQIAGKYEVAGLIPAIKKILLTHSEEHFLRVAAAKALLQIDEKAYAPLIQTTLQDKNSADVYKKGLITLFGEFTTASAVAVLNNSFSLVSKELQPEIVKALANSPEGVDIVLKRVRAGDVYARILLEPKIEERIQLIASAKQLKDYKALTADLNPANEEKQKLIKERLAAFEFSSAKAAEGRAVFMQNCAACHQIKKEGGLIGPQLDGIGNWGASALTEKIINPNQNISEAFRNYTIKMKNGKIMTGLYRREEGQVTVFANMSGEEFRLPKKDIAERKASKYTLMPDHFGEVIPPDQYNALLSYLLSHK